VAAACDGGLGSFGGRRLAVGRFVDLALLALDDLLNPLAEFAVVDDSKWHRWLGALRCSAGLLGFAWWFLMICALFR